MKIQELLIEAKAVATEIIASDPELLKQPMLRQALENLVATQKAEYVKKS